MPAYLAGDNPRSQSGHSGDEGRWEAARRLIVDAIDRDGTFLDVGCASGHRMETVRSWAGQDRHAVEPYGLDIAPELAALARSRLPHWADRIWVGNALHWQPSRLILGARNELRDADPIEHEVAAWGFRIACRTERPHSDPRVVRRAFWIEAS